MTKRLMVSIVAFAILAPNAQAQIRASERSTVSQTVDGTTITLDYSRPQVRGRNNLFGGEVPWGKVWTPGANWATTIGVDKPITLNGHAVAVGTYSVWFEVQPDAWTMILDPEPRRFHLMPPPEADSQVRFTVHPESGSPTDVLTWSFPAVRPTGATLQMAWANTTATLDIAVQPSRPVTVTAEAAQRYVGSYRFDLEPPLGGGTVQFDITYEDNHLVAQWENPPTPRLGRFWLAPLGASMFHPVELEKNEIFDIITDIVFEFTPLDGQAAKFEFRALGDELWGTAERTH
jgi:hypothetical protein